MRKVQNKYLMRCRCFPTMCRWNDKCLRSRFQLSKVALNATIVGCVRKMNSRKCSRCWFRFFKRHNCSGDVLWSCELPMNLAQTKTTISKNHFKRYNPTVISWNHMYRQWVCFGESGNSKGRFKRPQLCRVSVRWWFESCGFVKQIHWRYIWYLKITPTNCGV